jgi:hypothetical protein
MKRRSFLASIVGLATSSFALFSGAVARTGEKRPPATRAHELDPREWPLPYDPDNPNGWFPGAIFIEGRLIRDNDNWYIECENGHWTPLYISPFTDGQLTSGLKAEAEWNPNKWWAWGLCEVTDNDGCFLVPGTFTHLIQ